MVINTSPEFLPQNGRKSRPHRLSVSGRTVKSMLEAELSDIRERLLQIEQELTSKVIHSHSAA